jgi:single-strand DNA-binding protein
MQTTIKTFGNVTKDAQTRTSKNNRQYVAFTVAIDQDNAPTKFVLCSAWGKQKQFAAPLKKGDRVTLIGEAAERAATDGGTLTFVSTTYVKSHPRQVAA